MEKKHGFYVLGLLLVLTLGIVAATCIYQFTGADYTTCAYSRDLEVTGCDTDLDYVAFPFDMPAALLISLGMLQADMDDVFVQEGGTPREVFACNAAGSPAAWRTFTEDLDASEEELLTVYFGDTGTRNQWWVGSIGDFNYCEDTADFVMEGTWSFYVSADIKCYDVPDSGSYTFVGGRPGCYALTVGGTAVRWSVWGDDYTGTSTFNLCPDSYLAGTNCYGGGNYAYLCDGSTSTAVGSNPSVEFKYGLANPSNSLDREILGVSVSFEFYYEGASSGTFTANLEDSVSGSVTYFSPITISGAAPTIYSTGTKTAAPDGSNWGYDELRSLVVGGTWSTKAAGWSDGWMSELYAQVQYRSGSSVQSLETPLTIGVSQFVMGYYLYNSGTPLLMLADLTNVTSGTVVYAYSDIRNFGDEFRVGEINGAIDDARLRVQQ